MNLGEIVLLFIILFIVGSIIGDVVLNVDAVAATNLGVMVGAGVLVLLLIGAILNGTVGVTAGDQGKIYGGQAARMELAQEEAKLLRQQVALKREILAAQKADRIVDAEFEKIED